MGIGYRNNAVDIHSHILPGIDDGAKSITEALQMLRTAREEGVRDVIATSHYGLENGYNSKPDKIRKVFDAVVKAAEEETRGPRLYLDEEVFCSQNVAECLENKEAMTLNDTCYVLVEFFEDSSRDIILERLEKLIRTSGVRPILAHAERYRELQESRNYLKRIQDTGVLLQVNAYDLALNPNQHTRETAQWLAEERMISFIGSDMHGMPPKRAPKMRAGIDWLYEHTDEEYADCVIRKNAETKLRIRKYVPWEENDYFMSTGMATFFKERLDGRIVRCQVFPAKDGDNHNIARTVVELEDGRVYAIVNGIMGPCLFRLEAYADESNSYFGCDETGWYWRFKGTDREIGRKNLGGVEWEDEK